MLIPAGLEDAFHWIPNVSLRRAWMSQPNGRLVELLFCSKRASQESSRSEIYGRTVLSEWHRPLEKDQWQFSLSTRFWPDDNPSQSADLRDAARRREPCRGSRSG